MFLPFLSTSFSETPATTPPEATPSTSTPPVSPTGVLGSDGSLKTGDESTTETATDPALRNVPQRGTPAGSVTFTDEQQATLQSIINKNHGRWLDAGRTKALEDLGFKPENTEILKGILDKLGVTSSNLTEFSANLKNAGDPKTPSNPPSTESTPTKPVTTDNRFTQLESTIDDQSKQLQSQQNLITSLQESNQHQSETSKRKEMQSQAMKIIATKPLADGVIIDEVVDLMVRNWRVDDDLKVSVVDNAGVTILGLDGNPLDSKANGEKFFKERPFLLSAGKSGAGASPVVGGQSNPLTEAIANFTPGAIAEALTKNPELRTQLKQALVPQADVNPYAHAQLKTGGEK